MKKFLRLFPLMLIALILLSCNLISINIGSTPSPQPSAVPPAEQSSPAPPAAASPAADQPSTILDPCSLVTQAEVEAILAEPANPPVSMSGGCNFTNAKDSLYALSVAAAQGADTNGILQGQAMLLGFAGAPLDDARMTGLRTMAENQDYQGFFSDLVAAVGSAPNIKAQLVDDKSSNLVYWAWISAPPRAQGAYVAVRGPTMVSINLVVSETQTEESMLSAAAFLAAAVFDRLPGRFSLPAPTAAPAPTETPAPPAEPTLVPTPTYVGLGPPALLSPQNGASINTYPRKMTLQWSAIQGAVRYLVEVEACSNGNPNDCFSLINSETPSTSFDLEFVGMQPGRWRVRAVDANGQPGAYPDWWQFTFTQ